MTTATATAGPSTRFCPACLRDRAVDEFRRRRKGGHAREGKCNDCHAEYMRTYRRRRRSRAIDRFASHCARAESREVVAFCTTMFRRLGGVAGFARVFKDELDAAREVAPGSRRVCNMLMAIMKVLEATDAVRPLPRDPSLLSDEELEEEIQAHMIALLRDNPLLAVAAAQLMGWTVIPPEDTLTKSDEAGSNAGI